MRHVVILTLAVVASLVAMSLIAQWAIGPMNRARTRIGAPTRFLITDIFWLMVLLQEGLAFATQFVPKGEPEAFKLILFFLIFAAIALWAGGVSFSSQAGIQKLLDRSLVVLLLLPGTLLVMIGVPATTVITLIDVRRGETDWSKYNDPHYIAWASLIVGALLLRVLSTWLAARIFADWKPPARQTPNLETDSATQSITA